MTVLDLREPVFEGGINNTNYFNGRLLTADALVADQKANRKQHQQLGLAAGAGVVSGLEVRLAEASEVERPVLHIGPGLAFNRLGEAIALPRAAQVGLVREFSGQVLEAGMFAECKPTTSVTAVNPGIYILTAQPTSGLAEYAPKTGLRLEHDDDGCDRRYVVEGVKFRLVELGSLDGPLSALAQAAHAAAGAVEDELEAITAPAVSLYRNRIAYLLFGTTSSVRFAERPFARSADNASLVLPLGRLGELEDNEALTTCEVPLAAVYWTGTGIQFIDRWSVRRPLVQRFSSAQWPLPLPARGEADAQAMFLQFQEHLEDLIVHSALPSGATAIEASDYFAYLPPAGLLPLAVSGGPRGVDVRTFFDGMMTRDRGDPHSPEFIEGAKCEPLFREARGYPPVRVASKEVVWVYRVRENRMTIAAGQTPLPQPYVVFANGHVPYYGTPRFDQSRWNYSNYSSSLLGPGPHE